MVLECVSQILVQMKLRCHESMAQRAKSEAVSGITSAFAIDLVCTTRRRIQASSSTNPRPEKGDLIPL